VKKIFFLLALILFLCPIKVIAVSADAVILMDEDSKRILYSKNIDKPKLIASTTKIMTAIIAIESNQLDNIVTIDDSILKAYGSNIYIEVGEKIKLIDLIYGLMLRSGNDAALAISNYLYGSEEEFVKRMNEKAIEIGMKKTNFVNSNGLDEKAENISTVYDMAILTRYVNKNEIYKKIVGTKKYIVKTNYKTYVWNNKNKLLDIYKYTTGGKTGFTTKARRTLVSSASKDNMNLIVVTLNDPDDWNTHRNLYDYGFNTYTKYCVLNKNKFNINSSFYKEELYILNNYYYLLKTDEINNISIKVKLIKTKKYKNKDKVGVADIYFKDKLIHSEDVYIKVSSPIESKSFWLKIWEWFKL